MSKLIFLDSENTLIKDPKKDPRYISEALLNVYGIITDQINLEEFQNMTAQEVAAAILTEKGFEQNIIDAKLSQYISELQYTYYNVIGLDKLFQTDKILMNGARDFVSTMQKESIPIVISSGQPERIMAMKQERTELQKYFVAGAYGDEAKQISDILKIAITKATSAGIISSPNETFVIGSYPKIIETAKLNGFVAIGVASGKYTADELRSAGATIVSKSINDRAVKSAITK